VWVASLSGQMFPDRAERPAAGSGQRPPQRIWLPPADDRHPHNSHALPREACCPLLQSITVDHSVHNGSTVE
jgi:hypothetical protein